MPYIHYSFKNIEPLRIADNKSSQEGQMDTICFIPGSTIRVMVINLLIQNEGYDFEKNKITLFSDKTKFMNAYPVNAEGKRMFPSPKGFYEDKTITNGKKEIENVVIRGEFDPGNKRANLGQFSFFEDDTVKYTSIEKGADLKIHIKIPEEKEPEVFRNEYIQAGYCYAGDIYVEDEETSRSIKKLFEVGNSFILGNARSTGLGKCVVTNVKTDDFVPFSEYSRKSPISDHCYMLLLSDTVMRDRESGEYIGIDLAQLKEKLGLEKEPKIEFCSTSINKVMGFNRTLGGYIPSVDMYEKGSVFKLKFPGEEISADRIKDFMNEGLGVRKNEGFGRVIILDDYEKISYKESYKLVQSGSEIGSKKEDMQTLKNVAKNYFYLSYDKSVYTYVMGNPLKLGGLSSSRIGCIDSLISTFLYDYEGARKSLDKYFRHAIEKEEKQNIQKEKSGSAVKAGEEIFRILDMSLEDFEQELNLPFAGRKEIMGVPGSEIISEEEFGRLKLKMLLEMIRFKNRK